MRRHQGLADDLAAEHPLPADLRARAAKEIELEPLQIERFEQCLDTICHRRSQEPVDAASLYRLTPTNETRLVRAMTERIEIVVIGAALNGLAAALALGGKQALRPASVTLIDAKDPRNFANSGFDGRASAITASSRRMFEAFGVWEAIAPHAAADQSHHRHGFRSGRCTVRPTLLQFGDAEPQGAPSAYIVENRHLYDVLFKAVDRQPADHSCIRIRGSLPSISARALPASTTDSGEHDSCGAGDSPPTDAIRRRVTAAGIKTTGWEYGQTGIVTAVAHELPHDGCAEEHFRPAGPFAILPLTGNRSSLVWTEASETARRLLALSDEDFLAELRQRFGNHRGAVTLIGPRYGYPLSLFIAEQLHRRHGSRCWAMPRMSCIRSPGSGLISGLRDAAALAEAVAQARYLGLDIGSEATLAQYSQWRRFDTNVTALATDALNRLFSNDFPGLRQLRDTGLKLVNLAPPLKALFMREAAGETGHLPKLMRGEPV